MTGSQLKQKLLHHLQGLYQHKIQNVQNEILSMTPSRDSDMKNSAGDKHETGRAMMHIELDNHKKHLAKLLEQKNELEMIDIRITEETIQFGSIAITSSGNYFFSVGIGKVAIDGADWFCVSMISPVGKTLQSKVVGDEIAFNGEKIKIEKII